MSTERDPFILDRPTGGRRRARDGIVTVLVAAALLLLAEGASIRSSAQKMEAGVERTVVLAVGEPAGWLADRLPIADAVDGVTAFLSPDDATTGEGGFAAAPLASATGSASGGSRAAATAAITPDSFDPAELGGVQPARLPALRSLLVTGDSLAQPLDVQLARSLAGDGVRVTREPRLGTGISKTDLVDWGELSTQQTASVRPDAVVMFIGANEGFPLPGPDGEDVACCGPEWAVVYATRARRMMDTYRRAGDARVYWLTLPLPRDSRRQEIARSVNAAIAVAAQPYRAHVRVLDMHSLFTPGDRYRAAMAVDGRQAIVREADGIHLNATGATLALDVVLERLREDFEKIG